MVPEILREVKDPLHQLALALFILHTNTTNGVVKKTGAMVPKRIIDEMKKPEVKLITHTSNKVRVINKPAKEDLDRISSELQEFVDNPEFEQIRADWSKEVEQGIRDQRNEFNYSTKALNEVRQMTAERERRSSHGYST